MSAPSTVPGGGVWSQAEVARYVEDTIRFAEAWGVAELLAAALAKKYPPRPAEHEQGHR